MHAVLAAATAMLAFATLAVAQCCCWLLFVCALEALEPLEALVCALCSCCIADAARTYTDNLDIINMTGTLQKIVYFKTILVAFLIGIHMPMHAASTCQVRTHLL